MDEIDDPRDWISGTEDIERIEAGRLEIKVHGKYTTTATRELYSGVGQRHTTANATLE